MVYTYVLYSHKDGRWYTGVTKDLRARMREHRGGRVLSTKSRRPLTLVYYEASLDEDDAWRRERYLKTGRGKRYLRQRLRVAMSTTWQSSWNGP
ncbi:MAG: GIY-YIG nuclease family protein [Bacillati bacterium ANGP1]|uniref:GIY-YIG nuclease family protein n=1 Tax=Candidatus Segetimicrobium genomatis TaxID=2569760 RepID=A0A537LGE8_9BACT|nr:MAG: GIY-YIG nuclease family protein [Terrabacteria group bacterium ANGP1]TMJ13288.1 MAG: GIY-YIG nuclease family protein [Terrabacteria group bacterium ANGP1]